MSQFVQGKTSDNKLDMNLFLRVIWLPFLKPHTSSVHEADSLTCDHLSNRPSYCQNNPYNDETFDESFHTGDYLFIWCYYCNFTV